MSERPDITSISKPEIEVLRERLRDGGFIVSDWGGSENKRKARYYRDVTAADLVSFAGAALLRMMTG